MHGGAYAFGLCENQSRSRAQHRVPALRAGEIPQAITLLVMPTGVELFAIALDDQPAVDEQINAPYPVDHNLQLHLATKRTKYQTEQSFST